MIRRTIHFWFGLGADLVIEQTLMRSSSPQAEVVV